MNDDGNEFFVDMASWETEQSDILKVRRIVFIEEQQVDAAIEVDGLDPQCRHVLARLRGSQQAGAIGTGRLKPNGQIGRLAVLKAYRGRGVGSLMLQTLIELSRSQGHDRVFLHAQTSATPFYEKQGFRPDGKQLIEADILHITMSLRP